MAEDTTTTTEVNDQDTNKTTETEVKTLTMTQEELDKVIQKRLDRALKKADEEKAEAEKLAKMSAEERAKAEFANEKSKFEEERLLHQREKLELQTVKELATKGLPTEFSKLILSDSAESTMANLKEFEGQWQTALDKAVTEKLKGKTPSGGGGSGSSEIDTLEIERQAALKNGNMPMAIAIKNKIVALQNKK